jgi:hypothetical protein
MNRILLLAVGCSVLALGVSGCESRAEYRAKKAQREALKVISRLDCPQNQGMLTRTSVAADGASCVYAGDDTEVTVRLIKVSGDANASLTPVEDELRGLIPDAEAPAPPEAPEPPKAGEPPKPPEEASNKQTVRLPGITVETDDSGEKATVKLPGVHIQADDNNARVEVGGMVVEAKDDKNEVRITRDRWSTDDEGDMRISAKDGDVSINGGGDGFRLGGDKRSGFRRTFIKATDKADGGYTAVGYEARGPKAGPLVVAVVKSKAAKASGKSDNFFRDAAALVKLNVGG